MKIAEVTSTFPPYKAGMGNVAYYNAWSLTTLGHDVTVFTTKVKNGTSHTDEYPFEVQRLGAWFKYGNAGILPQLFYKLPKYDIIHLHYPFFGGAEIIYFLDKIKDLNLVVTYHMDVFGKGLMSKFFEWHRNNVTPKILDRADKIIVTSYDYARSSAIKDRLIAEPEKFVEIPIGVNQLLFKPRYRNKDIINQYDLHGKKTILFVGALDKAHYFKGINILIQAIKKIKARDDYRVIIIGEGDLKDSYQTMADSQGLGKKIIFAGFVPDDLLPKFYSIADMLVLPSIDQSEAFGIVSLEAMASGVPVITSDLPGVRSVVDKKKTGLLVKPGNVDNLSNMIEYLLDNPKVAKEYGKAGRAKVLANYTWDKVGHKLDHLIKTISK
ncbi:MAG: glycosyltransferase family 4 protein [Candidatus Komeilibacteria bacterium]|jgi:glycosyltransferase involved in cell wall biosynthesis|nr:glycosyltransferase family 4 protein [Candidatus Komeilibacteria bacterium]MBT4448069.1 glycosyltransferase family 4 protein [Candidatus Komeilibacteria bacterium]